jgi:hypothetical protein
LQIAAALPEKYERQYVGEIYADGPNASWLGDALPVTVTRRTVTAAHG